jgi:lysozyme
MELLTRIVAQFEKFEPKPYKDPVGKLSIGFGHLIKPGEAFTHPMSYNEALALLDEDLDEARHAVDRLFRHVLLSEHERDALTSFTFNLGEGRVEDSTLRQKLILGNRLAAAHEFTRWVWGTHPDGTKERLPGLVKRRDVESVWFLGASAFTVSRLAGIDIEGD